MILLIKTEDQQPTEAERPLKLLHKCKVIKYYIKTSARVGYAPPIWKRFQVQGLKESRVIFRGDKDRGLVSSEEVWTSPVI